MIEIIAQNLDDAKAIEFSGAHRIELVSRMDLDGLTPDLNGVEEICRSITIPVRVMIRPHNNGFEYHEEDYNMMCRNIKSIKECGVGGVVIGFLKNDKIDFDKLKQMINYAKMPITFHRAIDLTSNVIENYKVLTEMEGIDQVLSSGGVGRAIDHLGVLEEMYRIQPNKLLIGSGITIEQVDCMTTAFPKANIHMGSGVRVDYHFNNKIDTNILKKIVRKHTFK